MWIKPVSVSSRVSMGQYPRSLGRAIPQPRGYSRFRCWSISSESKPCSLGEDIRKSAGKKKWNEARPGRQSKLFVSFKVKPRSACEDEPSLKAWGRSINTTPISRSSSYKSYNATKEAEEAVLTEFSTQLCEGKTCLEAFCLLDLLNPNNYVHLPEPLWLESAALLEWKGWVWCSVVGVTRAHQKPQELFSISIRDVLRWQYLHGECIFTVSFYDVFIMCFYYVVISC